MLPIRILVAAGLLALLVLPGKFDQPQPGVFVNWHVRLVDDGTVQLQWKINAAIHVMQFEVERSRDEKNWETIASVSRRVTQQYTFTDARPVTGFNYYRVKLADSSGRFFYTPVKSVQVSRFGKLYLWPNPVKDILYIQTPYGRGSIDIIDGSGRVVLKKLINDRRTAIPVTTLKNGIYIIRVKINDETLKEKFIKE